MDAGYSHELSRSGAILKAIFDTAIDGIVIINNRGIIQTVNEATCKLFAYSYADLIGKNVSMLMPSPHHENHDQYLADYLKTGEAKIIGIGREVEGLRSDGTQFPMRLAVSEIIEAGGHYFAGFIHDLSAVKEAEAKILKLNEELEQKVTERTEELQDVVNTLLDINKQFEREIAERKKVEARLRKSEEELKEALSLEKELNELKSRFVSTASHEFRTPLSTILSSTALIGRYKESDQQEQRDKHLSRIRSAVNTLNSILNDFLSLSKIEEGKVHIKPEHHRIFNVVEEVLGDIEGLVKEGQKINIEIEDEKQEIRTDKQVLKNILFNLISNAIKYSPRGSTITCRAGTNNGKAYFEVEDNGIGIPEREKKHLFSRFFRASNAGNIQGTGLGLNIVTGYVKMLNGDISFESEENVGSTFTVEIPINTNE